jgi:hypothetical protein
MNLLQNAATGSVRLKKIINTPNCHTKKDAQEKKKEMFIFDLGLLNKMNMPITAK